MSTIIGRAPGRVSLAGGGTDLPAYYKRAGGAVVSFAIDRYATAEAAPANDLELVSIDSGLQETIPASAFARRVRPPILAEEFLLYQKAVAWHFGIDRGRLAVSSNVPTGAGLASSGSVCVALVVAAGRLVGENLERAQIAEAACTIEMEVLRRACGKQDQYASAYGGLNLIEFFRDGSVDVTPVKATIETRAGLAGRIMLFHNGASRTSVVPLQEQARRSESDPGTVRALDELKDMAYEMREHLEHGRLDDIGHLLHRAWVAKQHLNSTVAAPDIVRAYETALAAGATGGKLSGAGLAGTLTLYCPPERQDEVRAALGLLGWTQREVNVDWEGATVRAVAGTEEHDLARQ